MKKILYLAIPVIIVSLFAVLMPDSQVGAQAVPTFTPVPVQSFELVYTENHTIIDRGIDSTTKRPRTVTVRSSCSIYGSKTADLYPNTEWTFDMPFIMDAYGNVWAKLSWQEDKCVALKYNGVYFTNWIDN